MSISYYKCDSGPDSSPYPDNWAEIKHVQYCDPLILVRCIAGTVHGNENAEKFIVGRAYKVNVGWTDNKGKDVNQSITVPCGLVTDLISIPKLIGKITDISKVGKHLEACVVHDFLYGAQKTFGRKTHKQDRKFADDLMNLMMKEAKVNGAKRYIIYKGVSSFASRHYKKAKNKFLAKRCICKDSVKNIC